MGISTHILDVTKGRPAADVPVLLERFSAGSWAKTSEGRTDADGRVKGLLVSGLEAGKYRITFDVADYLCLAHGRGFYPEVTVTFVVENPSEHFHVPLLLSPFGFSTYRGS